MLYEGSPLSAANFRTELGALNGSAEAGGAATKHVRFDEDRNQVHYTFSNLAYDRGYLDVDQTGASAINHVSTAMAMLGM